MASLAENVAKVVAAHSALKTAIAAKGATVPDGAKLSDLPALVESIPEASAPIWNRPANWPRIDLIPVRGLSYDVIYLIVEKPAAGHGLCMSAQVQNDASTWYMERVTVSDDGQTVTAVEGSRVTSSGTGLTKVALPFPSDDPEGTVYAVRVGVTDPEKKFLSSYCPEWDSPDGADEPHPSDPRRRGRTYNSGVVQEMIVRIPGRAVGRIGGSVPFKGPRHVALYNMSGMNDVGFRLVYGLEYAEFREGGYLLIDGPWTPGFNVENTYDHHLVSPVADWDDDFQLRVASAGGYSTLFLQRHDGTTYPFDQIKGRDGASAAAWDSVNNLSCLFTKFDRVRSIQLPAGLAPAATSCSRMFFGCNHLESLTLPDGFGGGTGNLDCTGMFASCPELKSVTFPSSFGASAAGFTRAELFSDCASLTSVVLPDGSGNTGPCTNMFRGCASLVSVDFGATARGIPTYVNGIFSGCAGLTTVTGAFRAATALSLSDSPRLTHDSLVTIIDGLSTVTTTVALTLGSVNTAKLTDEEIAVATSKGWTVS